MQGALVINFEEEKERDGYYIYVPVTLENYRATFAYKLLKTSTHTHSPSTSPHSHHSPFLLSYPLFRQQCVPVPTARPGDPAEGVQ